MAAELTSIELADGPAAARRMLDDSPLGAVELARPRLDDLPYRNLVRALLRAPGFRLDFRGQAPDQVIAMVADRLVGPAAFLHERALLARDIAELAEFASALVGGCRPQISIRTYFAPGDLLWHVDRLGERSAFRLLWPIARPAGMRITSADNIDERLYLACARREHPQLCRLDTTVLNTGAPVEQLWAHRPKQLQALASGEFPFVRDPAAEWQVRPGAASIHRVETPGRRGTYHCSTWANRGSPGLQIVVTAAAD